MCVRTDNTEGTSYIWNTYLIRLTSVIVHCIPMYNQINIHDAREQAMKSDASSVVSVALLNGTVSHGAARCHPVI